MCRLEVPQFASRVVISWTNLSKYRSIASKILYMVIA
jgi:hypothetical protein